MKDQKRELRDHMKEKLAQLKKPEYEQLSYEIAQYLYMDKEFQSASHIGLTISNFPEVDTYQIIRTCWRLGKVVSIPKCLPKTREMEFRKLDRFDQLESTYSHLYEPIVHNTKPTNPSQIDLLIVPGLVFTHNGYRLGFGGGYYDRFLNDFSAKTLSLAFTHQLMESIPYEEHDMRVQKIITNEGIICVS